MFRINYLEKIISLLYSFESLKAEPRCLFKCDIKQRRNYGSDIQVN